jgi:isopenicillin-N epimerase
MQQTHLTSRRAFLSGLSGFGVLPVAGNFAFGDSDAASAQTLVYRPSQPIDWDEVRNQYFISTGMGYFDCGSLGPVPAPVFYSLIDSYRALANFPMNREVLRARRRELKQHVAEFIGAPADEVMITRNTTEGLSLVAAGLDLKAGDEVLLSSYEHPSGLGPWQVRQARHGIHLREIDVPLEPRNREEFVAAFDRAVGSRTRVLAISHITTYTGLVLPVRDLCAWARQRRIFSIVDGAHAPGMIPVDVKELGCDAYACSPHKWLNAPQGTGILYVERDAQRRVWPTVTDTGWQEGRSIDKYEHLGQVSDPLALAVSSAISFQSAIGKDVIRDRIRSLAARFREGAMTIPGVTLCTPRSTEFSGGITTLKVRDLPNQKLLDWMAVKYNVVVDTADKPPNTIRVSTHIYNSVEQIDRLLGALTQAAAKGLS